MYSTRVHIRPVCVERRCRTQTWPSSCRRWALRGGGVIQWGASGRPCTCWQRLCRPQTQRACRCAFSTQPTLQFRIYEYMATSTTLSCCLCCEGVQLGLHGCRPFWRGFPLTSALSSCPRTASSASRMCLASLTPADRCFPSELCRISAKRPSGQLAFRRKQRA